MQKHIMREDDSYKQEYSTLGIALAGVHATAPNQWSSSTAISIQIPDKRLNCYLGNLIEGGTVIDKRTCDEDDVFEYVVSGPMLQESLPNGTMSAAFCSDSHSLQRRNVPIKCEDVRKCKSFDYIALDLYCELWSGLGARIGKRLGDTIMWNDGEIQSIPSVDERWSQTR